MYTITTRPIERQGWKYETLTEAIKDAIDIAEQYGQTLYSVRVDDSVHFPHYSLYWQEGKWRELCGNIGGTLSQRVSEIYIVLYKKGYTEDGVALLKDLRDWLSNKLCDAIESEAEFAIGRLVTTSAEQLANEWEQEHLEREWN